MNFKNRKTFRFETFSRTIAALILGIALSIAPLNAGFFTTGISSIDETLGRLATSQKVEANSSHANLASGNLSFSVNAGNTNQISSNDDWLGVNSVEGYFGQNLTATHGVDPQTVLGTEFGSNALPSPGNSQVNANKGNPSAYNAGGVTEFDTGSYLAIGFQGNVQANPYLVFYLNTTGRSNVTISYTVMDIDGGSNDAVSPIALQYRVGSTGLFTNLPDGYIADVTQGPNLSGQTFSKSVVLPAAAANQPQVQVRLITTNAADSGGGSTPDEWIGVNNFTISSFAPTAAPADISGRVMSHDGRSVSGAIVTLVDEFGLQRTAATNSFGYYRLTGINVGTTYVVAVASKRYQFEPQVVTLMDSIAGLNFYSLGPMVSITTVPEAKSKAKSVQSGRLTKID